MRSVPLRRLEITQIAKRDLDDVFDYTHEEWGLDQAFRCSDEMIHAVAQLSEFPNLGAIGLIYKSGCAAW